MFNFFHAIAGKIAIGFMGIALFLGATTTPNSIARQSMQNATSSMQVVQQKAEKKSPASSTGDQSTHQNLLPAKQTSINTNSNIQSSPAAPVRMTRAEYQTKYGVAPDVPPAAPKEIQTQSSTPVNQAQPNGTLCNGTYGTACPAGQDFVCPSGGGKAYCQAPQQQNSNVSGTVQTSLSCGGTTWGACPAGQQFYCSPNGNAQCITNGDVLCNGKYSHSCATGQHLYCPASGEAQCVADAQNTCQTPPCVSDAEFQSLMADIIQKTANQIANQRKPAPVPVYIPTYISPPIPPLNFSQPKTNFNCTTRDTAWGTTETNCY